MSDKLHVWNLVVNFNANNFSLRTADNKCYVSLLVYNVNIVKCFEFPTCNKSFCVLNIVN